MSKPYDWEREALGSARRALTGQTTASLLAYSLAVDPQGRRVHLKAHFDEPPTLDEIENLQAADTEILCDFADDVVTETEFELVIPGREPVLLPVVAYRRGGEPPASAWRRFWTRSVLDRPEGED